MKNEQIIINFIEHTNKEILFLDTNVFLLFLQGLQIEKFPTIKSIDKETGQNIDKKTIRLLNNSKNGFSINDYRLLARIISNYRRILTTPHVLTEISNLNKSKNVREKIFHRLVYLIETKLVFEEFVPIEDIISERVFNKFGVADIGIVKKVLDTNIGVITTDSNFFGYLMNINIASINFKHFHQRDIKKLQ